MSAIPLQRIEGKYEIVEKIREGGMGAIYKVRHRLLDEIRVIKLMRPQLVEDDELRARFVREARIAIKLRHPNIAQLYDFTADEDGTALIVMEFIHGKTLEDLLKSVGPPPLGVALEIAQQSLGAIGYLHSKGFVHRDISPDNLMMTEDTDGNPQIKLIDLGIAKILGGADAQLTRTGTFLGKLRYASPEQFGSEGAVTADARGDLYSFGIVLYELLTGTYPIAGHDPSSIIAGHLFRPPLPFEETDRQERVPPGLRAAVFKALAKNAAERFPTARDFAKELAAFRQPGDLLQGDWKRLIEESAATAAADIDAAAATGDRARGTQYRLDEHSGRTTTSTPSLLMEVRPRLACDNDPGSVDTSGGKAGLALPPRTSRDEALIPLLDEARVLAARKDLKGAGQLLRRAERLAPGNSDVEQLRELICEVSRRRSEERRRKAQIERRAAEIGKRLDLGDLDGGAVRLADAAAELGEAESWQRLHARLAALRAETRLAKADELPTSARRHAANINLDEVLQEVEEAQDIEPGTPLLDHEAGPADPVGALPRRIRRFTLHELIARGRSGSLYKAYDPVRGGLFGLKVVPIADETARERLLRGGRIWLNLTHPNILRVLEIHPAETSEPAVIVTEFVDGVDLATLMGERLLTLEAKLEIALQLSEALAYLHDQGLIHREVKPRNVLVSRGPRALLLDSGIARPANPDLERLTRTGMIVGDLRYMAPEQLRGKAEVRSDIFSLGALMYELLLGEQPRLDDRTEMFERLQGEPGLPQRLTKVVERCLAESPGERYASAHDLADSLRGLMAGAMPRSGTQRQVVVLHGIRTYAGWQRTFAEVADDTSWRCRSDRWNFGYFSVFRFLQPWSRSAKVEWFRRTYREEFSLGVDSGADLPSIVAHSFGSYILGNALLRYPYLRFNKVLLCGSILPTAFPWAALLDSGQVQSVRNEYGARDFWTEFVEHFVPGTGASGRRGFNPGHRRLEQERFEFTHSEYFERSHMEGRWIPFLSRVEAFVAPRERADLWKTAPKQADNPAAP